MASQQPQTIKNHTRVDPPYLFAMFILVVNVVVTTVWMFRNFDAHPWLTNWVLTVAIVLPIAAIRIRSYALKVQDRVIRLEERIRLTALLSPADQDLISARTTRQLIALRFASDAELPALARRAATEDLEPKAIKEAIVSWRPDLVRV